MNRVSGALIGRYGRSLFQAARERHALEEVRRDMEAIHRLWDEQPELKALLVNPGLSRKKVRAILEALGKKLKLHEISLAFVDVLLDKDRLDILSGIYPKFERLVKDYQGKVDVKVTTAVPVGGHLQKQIEQHLKSTSGKEPVVEWHQNPAIIGGIVIEWPDHVYDGSLARKLENMKTQLAGIA